MVKLTMNRYAEALLVSEWMTLITSPGAAAYRPELARELRGDGQLLHLHATDEPSLGEWLIRRGPDAVTWEHGHQKGDSESSVGFVIEHGHDDDGWLTRNLVVHRGGDHEHADAGVGHPDVTPAGGLAQRPASSSRLRSAQASANATASGWADIH